MRHRSSTGGSRMKHMRSNDSRLRVAAWVVEYAAETGANPAAQGTDPS
jgi:hypothetical protein